MSQLLPTPGERWRQRVVDPHTGALAAPPARWLVHDLRVRPGGVVGTVAAGDERLPVGLTVDVLGPGWRRRWLEAIGGAVDGAGGRAEARPGDPRVEAAAARGLDPVPPLGSVRSRCPCPEHEARRWCEHAAALAEAVAARLDEGRWELLWHLRGLQDARTVPPVAPTPVPTAAVATIADATEDEEAAVDLTAFWGDVPPPSAPAVVPWEEAPAAILRLGPLPTARGQAGAVEPILAHYRRVRDALRALAPPAPTAVEGKAGARRGRRRSERSQENRR